MPSRWAASAVFCKTLLTLRTRIEAAVAQTDSPAAIAKLVVMAEVISQLQNFYSRGAPPTDKETTCLTYFREVFSELFRAISVGAASIVATASTELETSIVAASAEMQKRMEQDRKLLKEMHKTKEAKAFAKSSTKFFEACSTLESTTKNLKGISCIEELVDPTILGLAGKEVSCDVGTVKKKSNLLTCEIALVQGIFGPVARTMTRLDMRNAVESRFTELAVPFASANESLRKIWEETKEDATA